jgi:hypothetical protein
MQLFAIWAGTVFQNVLDLSFRKAWKTCQRWGSVCPVGNWFHWVDPNPRASQPCVVSKFASFIPRRMTIAALCDLFYQILTTLDVSPRRYSVFFLCGAA